MDFLKYFDLDLDRDVYYAGETVTGRVVVENVENMRINGIRLHVRGKAHAEWKITRAGERRTVRQDEHYIDERQLLWGKEPGDESAHIPILPRGVHTYTFEFKLPESALPCSFESKYGTIRYYIRVFLDIPYASCPQSVKYFTIIGPHIDCMDERLLAPRTAVAKRKTCFPCCGKGPILLRGMLERTGYCCGENIRLKVEIQNGGDVDAWVICKLTQNVEFFINRGVLGLSKEVHHVAMEVESDHVPGHHTVTLSSLCDRLQVPVCPPTMVDVCGLIQIFYCLKVCLETEQEKEVADIELPITIATLPFRIPNAPAPEVHYEVPLETVEGGNYISSEFQLGQVYMGDDHDSEMDKTIIFRPVYVTVNPCRPPSGLHSAGSSRTNLLQVPSGHRTRCISRSRENVQAVSFHMNGSGQDSKEDVAGISRLRLDSSDERPIHLSVEDISGEAQRAETEHDNFRVTYSCGEKDEEVFRTVTGSAGEVSRTVTGSVGETTRTVTGSAAIASGMIAAAAAAAASSPSPKEKKSYFPEGRHAEKQGNGDNPREIIDCRLSSV